MQGDVKSNREKRRPRRVIGKAALRRDPELAAFGGRGPEDGTFLERRSQRRLEEDRAAATA